MNDDEYEDDTFMEEFVQSTKPVERVSDTLQSKVEKSGKNVMQYNNRLREMSIK
jgi:hypothetical protein